ncbi:disease resistance protein RPP13 [Beta vulgaris subsp. vulgaris]|uniref:disease resistance protein RPP13 n=1 Tax=Beta vulgaris subsp. vulgaris TaxID=3555 RepID=UPI0020371673|nr:disease resistance protein RPP13 [Beta vulgaris subsp. vulgaris]
MADSILTNLVQQLGGLALEEYKVLKGVGDQLSSLEYELRFMKKFLRNSEGKQQEHELVGELVDQIKEVAFEAEDVIESFLLNVERQKCRSAFGRVFHGPEYAVMLHGVAKHINGIKTRIDGIYDNKEKYGIEMGEGSMNPHFEATLQRRRKEVDEEMVGFKDEADTLLKKLTEGSIGLEIISIVGMGGLGKTTIAKRLFNDRIIKDHFKSHAWVSVSEDYNSRQLILDILEKVASNKEGIDKLDTDKLKEMLKTRLKDRKYIVFLDDVWQPHMWDEVKTCFPDTSNGSRILITTRVTDVARYTSPRKPHFLRFFTPEESWELFEKKVFQGDPCPNHLKTLGIDIVKRCKCLPLSIVVIASMLASKEKSERIWGRTLKDVSVHLGKDEACLEILALKGFIHPLGELTLEEVAESYLDALIDRSLVQAGTRRTDGGIKTCRIHDLIRDLCIREAKSENFMWAASKINDASAIVSKCKPRRLSVHHHTSRTVLSKNWEPSSIRAFLSFESQNSFVTSGFWKKLYTEYKLLRVLDLGASIKIETVPNDIDDLMNLRYLRLFLSALYIPESIYNLRNLQMLFVEGNTTLNIPIGALLKLQCLQQLILGKSCTRLYGNPANMLPKKQLKSLRVLSSIYPDKDFESAVMKGLCPDLRKLSVCSSYVNSWSLKNFFTGLPDLQSIKISFSDANVHRDIFKGVTESQLPSSLTKITLKSSTWSEDALNMLGKFPNLHILKLVDVKYPELTPTKGSFPRLHTLHLDNVQGGEVAVHPSLYGRQELAYPQLRHLFIKRCTSRFHPFQFTLPNLKDVEVLWPDNALADLLEQLKQENKIKCRLLVYKGE